MSSTGSFIGKLLTKLILIPADDIRFIVMNENNKRVLWRCSLMSTKTRKCPARVTMFKDNPPRFVMGQCRHEHMELVRGQWFFKKTSCCVGIGMR